ncbi:uncharacterized protein ACA1_230450 [Acanthamoeba castellanii str. Neff]|uniref:Uncharacterized protein n=1 Tax=Acanthamoeba castellanii (strain ATCC 30010 / Neff) TaxID=1257118 RepID=L8H921_ACACF|nr:uncharacterized protein ACA1_230450 [Acanthamoeba castellanii str. Neff]ELR21660.1 hypothetical protein ACA1_230450 [Acanthamoeba castellanii str. Neff]
MAMWVRAKKARTRTEAEATETERSRNGPRVEISHERRQSRGLATSIKSPEGRRRVDTSPVMIQRRDTSQGRAIIQAAESLLTFSPPLSATSPILSPPLSLSSTSSSPINVRRAARAPTRYAHPPLSPFGGRLATMSDLSGSKIVFDHQQRAALQEKSDQLMKVQRLRDQHDEKRKRNGDLQREDEERGMWNQFWDVLEDVEAERAKQDEDEEDEDAEDVLNDKCGDEGFRVMKCASGALQLMQLQERFKRYRDEAVEEERLQVEQLGVSPVVGSGCFEDNEFFRHLLQVRHRSATTPSSTPPLLFSL